MMSAATSPLTPNPEFAVPAAEERLQRAAQGLRAHGTEAEIVGTSAEALGGSRTATGSGTDAGP